MKIETPASPAHPWRAAAVALLLSACGGGGSATSEPSAPTPVAPYQARLLAGVAAWVDYGYADPEPGCIDGPALGAKLDPQSAPTLAHAPSGQVLMTEYGHCDGLARLRAIDPVNNTITTRALGSRSERPLSTFMSPVSIAGGPSGEVYVVDSDVFTGQLPPRTRHEAGAGPGIWKVAPDGQVSLLAGVALPSVGQGGTGVDGQGAAASFGFMGTICYASDGQLYVTDNGRVRVVTLGGAVSTLATSPGVKQHRVVACGPDGSVLVRRWFDDATDNDYYDPVARQSVARPPASDPVLGGGVSPMAYLGPANPSAIVPGEPQEVAVAVVNLATGSTMVVAAAGGVAAPFDLAATPPVLPYDAVLTGAAINRTDFDLLTRRGVVRLTRVP